MRGIVFVGPLADAAAVIDLPVARVAGDTRSLGMLTAVRIGGAPALVVSDARCRERRPPVREPFLGRHPRHFVGNRRRSRAGRTADRSHDLRPACGGAGTGRSLSGAPISSPIIDTRRLPAGTRPTRLLLDLMVAPDGAGAKAVVSAFVNERLLGSTLAATGEADPSRPALAGRTYRHHGQDPGCRRTRQRSGRLPIRASGLSGAASRIVVARTCEHGRRRTRFFRSLAALCPRARACCCRRPLPISPTSCSAWSPRWSTNCLLISRR